jgi:hypothetical protein
MMRIIPVLGNVQQRLRALATPGDAYVINRENTQWLVEHFKNGWPFDMVVLDECFSPDTMVDVWGERAGTVSQKPIAEIAVGEEILNAYGKDKVYAKNRNKIDRAAVVTTERGEITCSENHLFFTTSGWVRAGDLHPGDYLVETAEAMRLVREYFQPHGVEERNSAFLRHILFSEMAESSAGGFGESAISERTGEESGVCIELGERRNTGGGSAQRKNRKAKSYAESRVSEESIANTSGKGSSSAANGQRQRINGSATALLGSVRPGMDSGISGEFGQATVGLSDVLQGGLRKPGNEDCDRSGRVISQGYRAKSGGCETRQQISGVRVESVAVYESGDIALDRYRDADGFVYFYDLGVTRHPSYSVSGVLVHNCSSFKNGSSKRFKAVKLVRSRIKRIVALTGTPASNGLEDLWAQVYLLDGGARLGKTMGAYRDKYFNPGKRNRTTVFNYTPKDGSFEMIKTAISDICISMKASDYIELPDVLQNDIPVMLDASAAKAYRQLETELLLQVDENTITAGSAGVLTGKLLQLCNGAIYDESKNPVKVHDSKIEAFLELVEQLNGQHALAFYNFQHDRDRLVAALADTGLRVRVYSQAKDEQDWNNGLIDILLAHPASCGYGLNLQHGGHHAIWFGLTWNLEWYEQANKRLHRQGQEQPVVIHRLIVQGGMDEAVIEALNSKGDMQNALMAALKARIGKLHS